MSTHRYLLKYEFDPEESQLEENSRKAQQLERIFSSGGVSCGVEVGKLGLEISGNEPTEPLKNIKKALHPRFVPNAPVLYHDPKYGGWIDPYEVRSKPKKKEKDYEYY